MGRFIKAIGWHCFLVFAFSIVLSNPGWAQAPSAATPTANPSPEESLFMDIPQVVTSASFFKQSTKESPGTTYIVTAAQIDMGAVDSMADVLQDFVPGMYTTAHGFLGTLIGSRGVTTDTSSKTQYMIDGMNVNSHWNSGAAAETAMPFLGDIDKVEVIMGPGAIVHGSGAINGFINVIPKNGTDYQGWTLDTKYGFEQHLSETQMGYGKSWGVGRDLYLFAGIADSSGYNNYNNMSQTGASYVTVLPGSDPYFKVDDIFYPAVKVAEYFHWDDFKINTVFERNFYTPVEVWWVGQGVYHGMLAVNPEYKWDLSPTDSLTMDASLMLQDNDQIFLHNAYINSGLQTSANNNSGAFTGQYWNLQKGDIIGPDDAGNNSSESYIGDKLVYRTDRVANNQIAAGVEVGRRAFYGNGFAFFYDDFSSTDGISMPHDVYAWLEYSAFVEDVVNLTDKLTMTVGGREDGVSYPDTYTSYYNNIEAPIKNPSIAHFSPAIDFAYQVNPVTTTKLSYNEGFRFPNASDIVRNLSPRAEPGTSILETFPIPKPETMDSFEFDVHHDIPAWKMGWDLNTYYNMLHNTLGWDQPAGNSLGAEYNSPPFDDIGCELVDKWQILPNTTLDASYSFSRPINYDKAEVEGPLDSMFPTDPEGTQWARYPDQMVKLGTTSTFFTKWTFHWDMQYRAGVKYDPYGTTPADYAAYYAWLDHASIVFNAAIKYDISRNWWVKFSVKNLSGDRNTQPVWGLSNQFYAVGYSAATLTYVEIGCKF